ncbi:MAG: AraC family transcriptional regulator [Oscillospiraceae bacterium]|nr:AraC family transcriptional regulator [Oscillospiraceae bacterium]
MSFDMINKWFVMSRSSHPEDFSSVLHYHNSYEIFVMLKGSTTILVDDELIDINQGEILLIRLNDLHKNNGGTYHERYAVHFTERYLHTYFTDETIKALIRGFDNKKRTIKGEAFLYIIKLLESMESESELVFIHLAELITRIYAEKNQTAPRIKQSYRITEKIFAYINENYAYIESLESIAAAVHISKQYLCAVVKKDTGLTVSDYLNEVRINNACELLRSCNKKITDVAAECGYNSSIYFGRVFKEIVGMTPSEYRKYAKTI